MGEYKESPDAGTPGQEAENTTKDKETEDKTPKKDSMDFSQSRAFLECFFSQRKGLIEIRAIGNGKTENRFFKPADKIPGDKLSELNKQGYNIYFGVCTRKGEKGDKRAVLEMCGLWIDVDSKHFESKQAALEHIQRTISSTGLDPTFIVDSGNGYHIYFLFKELQIVKFPQDISKLEEYVKGTAKLFNGDHTHDLFRVMRLPGFYNMKDPSNPKLCNVVSSNPERRYNLSSFENYWIEASQSQSDANFKIEDMPKEIPPRFFDLLEKDTKLCETWEGRREDLKDNSGSGKDMALADALIKHGFTDGEIARILIEAPYLKENERTEAYLRHTIAKAKALVSEKSKGKNDTTKSSQKSDGSYGSYSSYGSDSVKR